MALASAAHRLEADLHRRLHRARAARTARRRGRMERRQAHRVDRDAAALRRARRTGGGLSHSRRERARHRARYRLGLRRKAHREAAIEAARLAKAAGKPVKVGLDPRRGIHLGVFPSGRRHRDSRAAWQRTARSPPGNFTTTIPARRESKLLTPFRTSTLNFTRRNRRCGKAPIAGWRRLPMNSRANRTWTIWRTLRPWTRWIFA